LSHGVVISHDCEWTKVEKRGTHWPLLVAPAVSVGEILADVGLDQPGQDGQVRGNQFRYLFYLRPEGPLQDEDLVVDLRLIQPVTAEELLGSTLVTSMGPGIKPALQQRLVVYLAKRELVGGS
jgi:hypothetical protein